jgi:VIT1/CCC1 family predicted Fe2+/Mn2+ transporter
MNQPSDREMKKLEAEHTPAAIQKRLRAGPEHSYLKDFIYGAIDGTVTTFAIVAGVAGAQLSAGIVIILGLANVLADGFSMAVSNFLANRADQQVRAKARRNEETHIRKVPEGEREEIRQIFASEGFNGDDLERAVKVITSDINQWVDTMIREELGMPLETPSPVRSALMTFVAFVAVGLMPLAAFILDGGARGVVGEPFLVSAVLTGITFFAVGAFKGRYVEEPWYWSGLETLAVGGGAAALAYVVGAALKGIAPGA